MKLNSHYRIAILGAVVSIAILAVTAIVILTIYGGDLRTTPAIASILGFLATIVPVLLNLLKTERVQQLQEKTNGVIETHAAKITELDAKVNGPPPA